MTVSLHTEYPLLLLQDLQVLLAIPEKKDLKASVMEEIQVQSLSSSVDSFYESKVVSLYLTLISVVLHIIQRSKWHQNRPFGPIWTHLDLFLWFRHESVSSIADIVLQQHWWRTGLTEYSVTIIKLCPCTETGDRQNHQNKDQVD